MAIISIPVPLRVVIAAAVVCGFIFAANRHALRRGGKAVTGINWPHKQSDPRAVAVFFANGDEKRAVITDAYCTQWFAAVSVKAGRHKHFIAAAADGADHFRQLRTRLFALYIED